MHPIIQMLEKEQMRSDIPDFKPGDTVKVAVWVLEEGGDTNRQKRQQIFEGIVIAKSNRGINSNFTVRKISDNVGVERVFLTHSRLIAGIQVIRRGRVRRAKLYYLRDLRGRAARIREKLPFAPKKVDTSPEAS